MPEWHGSTMSTVPPWLIPSVPEIKVIFFALAVQHSFDISESYAAHGTGLWLYRGEGDPGGEIWVPVANRQMTPKVMSLFLWNGRMFIPEMIRKSRRNVI